MERGEEALREDEFGQTLRGRLSKWSMTRWLFDPRTRQLQVVIVLGLLVALLGVMISFALSQREVQAVDQVKEEDTQPIPKLGDELLQGREASEDIIRKFYQADSIDDLVPLIRQPELMRPLMEKWYATQPVRKETGLVFDSVTVKNLDGTRYYLHFVYFEDDIDPRPIAVEETAEGPRVDWETAAGYLSVPWDAYRKQRSPEMTYMRVIVSLDNYHNFEFEDSREWSCFRLQHPDAGSAIYGYVKRYSELDRNLREALGPNEKRSDYFILGLRFPPNAASDHAVFIDEILQDKWVRRYEEGEAHFDAAPSGS